MRHSLSKGTAFNGETTPRHTFLCSDSQCLPPGDPRILCAKHGSPITGKSFITLILDPEYCKETQHKHRYGKFSRAFYLLRYTIISFDL